MKRLETISEASNKMKVKTKVKAGEGSAINPNG
jgi:hypothetical protein